MKTQILILNPESFGLSKLSQNLWIMLLIIAGLFAGCAGENMSDAYGQFEATETTVSAEIGGKLLKFQVEEGYDFDKNQQVGVVDTSNLVLQRQELQAQMESVQAQIVHINAEVEVQKENLQTAQTDLNRIEVLKVDGAATQKELDDAEARVRIVIKQIDALQTQKQRVHADIKSILVRIAQVNNQLRDAIIINPLKGTVLTSFVEPYEVVRQGQPLYSIANLDTLLLHAYVSGAQLPNVKLGQQVEVLIDKNKTENESLGGRVSWIASDAEFTPQQIQTKQERVTQVYAVEVKVPNRNGKLKIGMPGEINFSRGSSQAGTN